MVSVLDNQDYKDILAELQKQLSTLPASEVEVALLKSLIRAREKADARDEERRSLRRELRSHG